MEHGVATLDLEPKTLDEWEKWFYNHNIDNHTLFVAEIDKHIAGYASLSSYREKESYKSTVMTDVLSILNNDAYNFLIRIAVFQNITSNLSQLNKI